MRRLRKPFFICAMILVIGLLTLLVGLPSPGEIQAQTVASPITRYQVLYNALRYRVYTFTVRSYNVGTRTWYACGGWTTIASDPYYQADHQYQGVAYKWGGGDTLDDLGSYPCCERFGTRLDNGDLVGDTDERNWYHCYPDPKPVCPDAAGVDCSGFVTRVWGRPANEKYGTSTLPDISTPINFTQGNHQEELPRKMRMGDIFNYVGNHVVLLRYFENYPDHTPHFYESNWDANAVVKSEGWDVVWPVTNDNTGYRPYRYNNIVDDVYLPDVKASYDGWNSTIIIRNNGYGNAIVQVTFYDSDGNAVNTATESGLAGRAIWMLDASSVVNNFSGSAVVAADMDVSVVVENFYDAGGRYLAAAYPGETAPAATVYAPYVVKKWLTLRSDWRQTTDLIIQNVSTQTATVTITFYDSWCDPWYYCTESHQEQRTIPANGQVVVSGTQMPTWESGWDASMASAVIQSQSTQQPVAVVATTHTGVPDTQGAIVTPYLLGSYRAFTSTASKVYLPTAAREYYYYDSGLQIQNAGDSNTTFRIKYYRPDQSQPILTLTRTVRPYRSTNFWRPTGLPANYLGGAVVEVISGGPLVAMGQYDRFYSAGNLYGITQYEGVTGATQTNVMAHVWKSYPWTYTGIQAQNMGGSTASITLNFYNGAGDPAGSATKDNVYPDVAVNYWGEIPAINGSAVASSSIGAGVALQVNFDRLGDPSWVNRDGMMGYDAVR